MINNIHFSPITSEEKNNPQIILERLEQYQKFLIEEQTEQMKDLHTKVFEQVKNAITTGRYHRRKEKTLQYGFNWKELMSPEAWKVFSIIMWYYGQKKADLQKLPAWAKFHVNALHYLKTNDLYSRASEIFGWLSQHEREKYSKGIYTQFQTFQQWQDFFTKNYPNVVNTTTLSTKEHGALAYDKFNIWLKALKTPDNREAYTKEERILIRNHLLFNKKMYHAKREKLKRRLTDVPQQKIPKPKKSSIASWEKKKESWSADKKTQYDYYVERLKWVVKKSLHSSKTTSEIIKVFKEDWQKISIRTDNIKKVWQSAAQMVLKNTCHIQQQSINAIMEIILRAPQSATSEQTPAQSWEENSTPSKPNKEKVWSQWIDVFRNFANIPLPSLMLLKSELESNRTGFGYLQTTKQYPAIYDFLAASSKQRIPESGINKHQLRKLRQHIGKKDFRKDLHTTPVEILTDKEKKNSIIQKIIAYISQIQE